MSSLYTILACHVIGLSSIKIFVSVRIGFVINQKKKKKSWHNETNDMACH